MKPGRSPRINVYVRQETKALLDKLCEEYHLSMGAIVTTAIVDLYKARLGPQPSERKRRNGNGHS